MPYTQMCVEYRNSCAHSVLGPFDVSGWQMQICVASKIRPIPGIDSVCDKRSAPCVERNFRKTQRSINLMKIISECMPAWHARPQTFTHFHHKVFFASAPCFMPDRVKSKLRWAKCDGDSSQLTAWMAQKQHFPAYRDSHSWHRCYAHKRDFPLMHT